MASAAGGRALPSPATRSRCAGSSSKTESCTRAPMPRQMVMTAALASLESRVSQWALGKRRRPPPSTRRKSSSCEICIGGTCESPLYACDRPEMLDEQPCPVCRLMYKGDISTCPRICWIHSTRCFCDNGSKSILFAHACTYRASRYCDTVQ